MNTELVIIVAEDEHGHFILTRNYLRRSGITNKIVWVQDGQAVLDYLNKHAKGKHRDKNREFLLLLDIRMPKVNGEQVLLDIRSDDELKHLPVIILTCMDNPSEIERYHAMGCDGLIVKPVKYDTLINKMKELALYPIEALNGIKIARKLKACIL